MPEQTAPPPKVEGTEAPDINLLDAQESIAYPLEVRRRINDGEEVSDEEIENAVKIIYRTRANAPRKTKAPTPTITLEDF